jgi:hypothetical protein
MKKYRCQDRGIRRALARKCARVTFVTIPNSKRHCMRNLALLIAVIAMMGMAACGKKAEQPAQPTQQVETAAPTAEGTKAEEGKQDAGSGDQPAPAQDAAPGK